MLAVAAAAHPELGSEPGLGWGWLEALSRVHDVWAVVGEREGNREAIRRRFRRVPHLNQRLRVHFVPRPDPPGPGGRFPPLYYRTYRRWHERAFAVARSLHRRIRFDLAHQVNMIGYREPGFLWRLPLPFVWGPTDAATNLPLRFWRILGLKGTGYYLAYNLINSWQFHNSGRVRSALEAADGLAVASRDMQRLLERERGLSAALIHDTGPPAVEAAPVRRPAAGDPLRIVWSGLHIPRKGLPILLRAVARLPADVRPRVDVLGDGPQGRAWRRLARRLGVDRCCAWRGWIPREEALEVMRGGHLLAMTSLRDATSSVLMESLGCGLPVLCLDHCGFSDVVTPSCGVKVRPGSTEQVVQGFARAIDRLSRRPREVERLSAGAVARARSFSWAAHAAEMTRLYRKAIARWKQGRARHDGN